MVLKIKDIHIEYYCCPVKVFCFEEFRADTSHEVSALLITFACIISQKHNYGQK